MIHVAVTPTRIHVSGHANSAPRGFDIICAAVSALTLTLIQGLKSIAQVELYESVELGNICIEWQKLNDTGKALIDTWFLGICRISEEYQGINFINDDSCILFRRGALFMPDGAINTGISQESEE